MKDFQILYSEWNKNADSIKQVNHFGLKIFTRDVEEIKILHNPSLSNASIMIAADIA